MRFVAGLLIVMQLYWCYLLTHYGEPLWSSFCSSFSTLSATLGALLTAVGFFAHLLVGFIGPLVIFPCTWVFRHYLLLVQPSRCRLLVPPGSSHSDNAFCHRFRMPSSEHALSLSLLRSFWDAVRIVLSPTSVFMQFLFLTGGLLLEELSLSFACFSWCLVPRSLYLSGCLRSAGGPSSSFTASSFLWVILPFPWCRSSLLRSGAFLFLPLLSPLIVVSGVFQLLPSLGFIPQFPCVVLSFLAILDGRPSFPFHFFPGCPWFTFLFLSLLFVTSLYIF